MKVCFILGIGGSGKTTYVRNILGLFSLEDIGGVKISINRENKILALGDYSNRKGGDEVYGKDLVRFLFRHKAEFEDYLLFYENNRYSMRITKNNSLVNAGVEVFFIYIKLSVETILANRANRANRELTYNEAYKQKRQCELYKLEADIKKHRELGLKIYEITNTAQV